MKTEYSSISSNFSTLAFSLPTSGLQPHLGRMFEFPDKEQGSQNDSESLVGMIPTHQLSEKSKNNKKKKTLTRKMFKKKGGGKKAEKKKKEIDAGNTQHKAN